MIKIAICDDDAGEREAAAALTREYLSQHPELPARLSLFESGEALLDAVETGGGFDLYLLDVIMPGQNGIEVGKRLRELDAEGEIIYLTTSPDYAVDSYQTRAFFYLMKPVDREQFFEVCTQAAAALQRRRAAGFLLNTPGGPRLVPLDEILYAELNSRALRCHLTGGGVLDSRALRESFVRAVQPLLADRRFILCGASFVLNLYHVRGIERGEAILSDEGRVPLPRSVQTAVKRRWMEYWLEGGGPS